MFSEQFNFFSFIHPTVTLRKRHSFHIFKPFPKPHLLAPRCFCQDPSLQNDLKRLEDALAKTRRLKKYDLPTENFNSRDASESKNFSFSKELEREIQSLSLSFSITLSYFKLVQIAALLVLLKARG